MKIPSNKMWTQLNKGEVLGVINETSNMALDTTGQAKLTKRPVALMSSVSDANYSHTMAIPYFNGNYFSITDDGIFFGTLNGTTFTEETDFIPATTLSTDALVFNDKLVVTVDNNIDDYTTGGTDTYGLESLTSGVPHPLAIFDSQTTYKLAVGNGNTVKLLDTSYVASTTVLTLASQFIVTTMRYRNGYLYIGTKTNDGSEARIFIWNGSGTNAQYECPVGCEWVFSMTEFGSSVAAIVSSGQLIQVSGSQYVQLAALPVYYKPHARWQGAGGLTLNGKVFNRGMLTVGQTIYINVDGDTDTGFIPEMKSGIWVFDPEVGLYHRASSTTNLMVIDDTFNVTGNEITTSATHNLKTGDAVEFESVLGLTDITQDIPYYVTVTATNKIKLSLTREDVAAARYVTITGTPNTGDDLVYFPNSDSGSTFIATSGAIALTTINETPQQTLSSEVIWGTKTENEAGTAVYVLNAFHDSNNIGHLTTQRIYSENIEQTWNDLYVLLDGLVTENDKVIVKTQTTYQPTIIELDGAWADSETINSNNVNQTTAWANISVGDEIIITEGYGQGKTAHVTDINVSSTIYSIVLDEAIGTAGAVKFYRTSFQKIGEYTSYVKNNEYLKSIFMEKKNSPWIKIKVELRGADMAINMLELSNVIHKNT